MLLAGVRRWEPSPMVGTSQSRSMAAVEWRGLLIGVAIGSALSIAVLFLGITALRQATTVFLGFSFGAVIGFAVLSAGLYAYRKRLLVQLGLSSQEDLSQALEPG